MRPQSAVNHTSGNAIRPHNGIYLLGTLRGGGAGGGAGGTDTLLTSPDLQHKETREKNRGTESTTRSVLPTPPRKDRRHLCCKSTRTALAPSEK